MTSYACTHCGQIIFRTDQILATRRLWDLGEYRSEVYLVSDAHDWSALRRYDASLHEGWYCCRFIMMRMVVDKFGTGDALIVYADSVAPADEVTPAKRRSVVRLGADDFDDVLAAEELAIVKLGAIWCPPCRMMDAAIDKVTAAGDVGVRFFEVDVDEQPELAARFPNTSIPYTVVFRRGQPVGPGVVGGLDSRGIRKLVEAARAA